jgi:hypothetical protein
MSLSGTVTTSVMWLVAAATFIGAVVSLAKATGTPGRVDLRTTYLRGAGTQLAVVATALLAVAGTLNAQYDWYSSWSDLRHSIPGRRLLSWQSRAHTCRRRCRGRTDQDRARTADQGA